MRYVYMPAFCMHGCIYARIHTYVHGMCIATDADVDIDLGMSRDDDGVDSDVEVGAWLWMQRCAITAQLGSPAAV